MGNAPHVLSFARRYRAHAAPSRPKHEFIVPPKIAAFRDDPLRPCNPSLAPNSHRQQSTVHA